MCMYNLALDDELVRRTRQSFANEADMKAWLQRQVEALMIEYNTSQQTVRRSARAAIAAMRRQSELNGNAEMSLQDINTEIQQARLKRKTGNTKYFPKSPIVVTPAEMMQIIQENYK